MGLFDELTRIKTIEFWKEVLHWSFRNWSASGKKLMDPIEEKEWLPMLTAAALPFLLKTSCLPTGRNDKNLPSPLFIP